MFLKTIVGSTDGQRKSETELIRLQFITERFHVGFIPTKRIILYLPRLLCANLFKVDITFSPLKDESTQLGSHIDSYMINDCLHKLTTTRFLRFQDTNDRDHLNIRKHLYIPLIHVCSLFKVSSIPTDLDGLRY